MAYINVAGGGGVNLSVFSNENRSGRPVIFIHGIMQSHLSWIKQFTSSISGSSFILAPDSRGHGNSDKPVAPENYQGSEFWANDVQAVVDLCDQKPVLVGWSYGGYIVSDYLQKYGDSAISGINFVGAAVLLAPDFAMLGPGLLENIEGFLSPDLDTNIEATRRLVHSCVSIDPGKDFMETAIGYNMMTPVYVRAAMAQRQLNYEDVYSKVKVPVLISCGMKDIIVFPEMSEYLKKHLPHAEMSKYDKCGHAVFAEDPERFNQELEEFIIACFKQEAGVSAAR